MNISRFVGEPPLEMRMKLVIEALCERPYTTV